MSRMQLLARVTFTAVFTLGAFSQLPAQTAGGESSAEAQNAFASAARLQNRKQFDLAAEDWETFLRRYSADPLAPRAHYYAGLCRLQLQSYAAAEAHFRAAIEAGPNFELAEDAWLNLGWSQYSQGSSDRPQPYQTAGQTFRDLIERFPNGKHVAQALFYLGESEYSQGHLKRAIQSYQQLVDRHAESPQYADALYALGVAYEETSEHQRAKVTYERFLKDCASNELIPEIRMRHAETVLQTGNIAAAERAFAAVAQMADFNAADHALSRQAFCVAQQERFAEAGGLYAKLVERFPASEYRNESVISAARSFYLGKQFRQARRWLERALEGGGADRAEAAHWLCRILLDQKDPSGALKLADRQLATVDKNAAYRVHLLLDRADAIYQLDAPRAMDAFYAVARAHPNHELAPQALYNTAFVALEIGQLAEAKRVGAAFQTHFPKDPLAADVQHILAETNVQLGDYPTAAAAFQQLIRKHPKHAQRALWHVRLAFTQYLQKNHTAAIDTLVDVIPGLKGDELGEACFIIGISQFELGQHRAALESLNRGLEAAPAAKQADEVLLYLSRSQHALGKPNAAIKSIERLVNEFPKSELIDQAYYRLGEYQFSAGRHKPSQAAYRRVIQKWPKSKLVPHARYGLAWSQMKSNKSAAAVDTLTALIDSVPEGELASASLLARGIALRQANRYQEARRDLRAFLATGPTGKQRGDALFERGLAEAGEKEFDRATETLKQVVREFPDHPQIADVFYELAWAFKQSDNTGQATEFFRRMIDHSPEHPDSAEAYFHLAEQHYDDSNYRAALELFQKAGKTTKRDELRERALHKVAWTHYRLDQFAEAAATFQAQLDQRADGQLSADARFMLAECLFKQRNYREAHQAFDAATRDLPESEAMQVLVFLHGGQAAAQAGDWQQSLRLLNQVPRTFPDSSYLAEAYFERGRAQRELGNRQEALADFERAASASQSAIGARARFMIGEAEFEQREFNEAIKHYRRVIYGFGGETADEKIRPWQAMAAYEAARCEEALTQNATTEADQTKHRANAASFYKYLVQNYPEHKLSEQANKRLQAWGVSTR